ncbi:hypothetical protein Y032_0011g1270 [Ancylostoma ceylanicum]|uniref:EGF-like domain-containing protein n=1 Tax=Ancylostoma ceylanicum TaxID=53326 RepID=A0A016VDV1_9BILA|nr:hypothetical protein Y032_0011g1270 [Ancylostoma ceylanicum]
MAHQRRYKREKSSDNYITLAPSYELVLSHDEPSQIESTLAVTVEEGQSLNLKCTAGEGIDEQTLRFERELVEVKGRRSPRSVSQQIFNFEDATHSGLYECFARTSSGEEHSRKMRVSTKAVLPKDFVPCAGDDDYCGSNGRCGLKSNDKICVCDPGYVGQRCEHLLVKDYLRMSLSVTTAKVVVGAGGTLNIVLIFLTLLFACLFLKQRRRVRLLESRLPPSNDEKMFFVKPRNPYSDGDSINHDKAHLTRSFAFDEPLARPSRFSAIRKIRVAIRSITSSVIVPLNNESPSCSYNKNQPVFMLSTTIGWKTEMPKRREQLQILMKLLVVLLFFTGTAYCGIYHRPLSGYEYGGEAENAYAQYVASQSPPAPVTDYTAGVQADAPRQSLQKGGRVKTQQAGRDLSTRANQQKAKQGQKATLTGGNQKIAVGSKSTTNTKQITNQSVDNNVKQVNFNGSPGQFDRIAAMVGAQAKQADAPPCAPRSYDARRPVPKPAPRPRPPQKKATGEIASLVRNAEGNANKSSSANQTAKQSQKNTQTGATIQNSLNNFNQIDVQQKNIQNVNQGTGAQKADDAPLSSPY